MTVSRTFVKSYKLIGNSHEELVDRDQHKDSKVITMKVVALLLVVSVGVANAAWNLGWEDNFDGGNLKDRWNFEVDCNGGYNDEMQCYTDNRQENVRQENGILVISALLENIGGSRPFTSTRMTTKQNWVYGKFDIRARLPKGKHLWPAIWAMPSNSEYGDWPRSGEIDIMEYRGQNPTEILGTLHFGEAPGNKGQAGYSRSFPTDFSQDFHTFTLDWSPMAMQWIIDDVIVHSEPLESRNFWEGVYNANGQPFDKNFYIILNLAVGGSFFGGEPFDPSESQYWEKNNMEIDYVRAWYWT